jgi:hypothetical protein
MIGVMGMDLPAGNPVKYILGDVFMRKYPSYFNLNDNTVSFQVATEKVPETVEEAFIF